MNKKNIRNVDFNLIKLSSSVNIGEYKEYENEEDKEKIADFIYERFTERYIIPQENYEYNYLFSLNDKIKQFLLDGKVGKQLKITLGEHNIQLSSRANLKKINNTNWEIRDIKRDKIKKYRIEIQNSKSNIYNIIDKKNGFSIMANCCLMIEALESFYRGWKKSQKSELAFCNFFDHAIEFYDFHGFSSDFYKNVRCGIFHQAETTGGWKIIRKGPLFNTDTLTINATKFQNQLKKYLERYTNNLKKLDWNDDKWIKLRKKMKNIINNCKRSY